MDKNNIRIRRSDEYNNNELFHSDSFLGDEFSDDLYHFKYIKREKGKNGKWRYYYDKEQLKDDLGFDERDAYRKAKENESKERKEREMTYKWAREQLHKELDYKITTRKEDQDSKRLRELENWTNTAFKWLEIDTDSHQRATKACKSALKKYEATPLGKADKFISNGKNKLKRLLRIN